MALKLFLVGFLLVILSSGQHNGRDCPDHPQKVENCPSRGNWDWPSPRDQNLYEQACLEHEAGDMLLPSGCGSVVNGIFSCQCCGQALFDAADRCPDGTMAFEEALGRVCTKEDGEVVCASCGSHIGRHDPGHQPNCPIVIDMDVCLRPPSGASCLPGGPEDPPEPSHGTSGGTTGGGGPATCPEDSKCFVTDPPTEEAFECCSGDEECAPNAAGDGFRCARVLKCPEEKKCFPDNEMTPESMECCGPKEMCVTESDGSNVCKTLDEACPEERHCFTAGVNEWWCCNDGEKCVAGEGEGAKARCIRLDSIDDVACTEEAKLCPDGVTSVGRNSTLNCAFDPCPSASQVPRIFIFFVLALVGLAMAGGVAYTVWNRRKKRASAAFGTLEDLDDDVPGERFLIGGDDSDL